MRQVVARGNEGIVYWVIVSGLVIQGFCFFVDTWLVKSSIGYVYNRRVPRHTLGKLSVR